MSTPKISHKPSRAVLARAWTGHGVGNANLTPGDIAAKNMRRKLTKKKLARRV